MQFEVERNLNEMLILHEEILIHMKLFQRDASFKPYTLSTNHLSLTNSDSNDTKGGKKGHRGSRRSMESAWLRQYKNRSLTSQPQEAANIAKVFGGMVCEKSLIKLRANGVPVQAASFLCLRGVWGKV